jgi:hypothetical protein
MQLAGCFGRFGFVPFAVALLLLVTGPGARALPAPGANAPNATVADADGRIVALGALRGRPVLVFYESKDSLPQNRPLVDELAQRRARGEEPYRSKLAVVPVADVTSYDYWPIRGFVKSAIRRHARAANIDIFCDFSGDFGRALGVARGQSNVMLLGPDGTVMFSAQGPLDAERRGKLLELLGSV